MGGTLYRSSGNVVLRDRIDRPPLYSVLFYIQVAAMLVRLGQARIYLSDNDGPSSRPQHDKATAKAVHNARDATHQQRGWERGIVWSDGRN